MSKLAVAIPYYNGERYLKYCLQSIQAQTFKDFKIYIFNDQSPRPMPAELVEYLQSINVTLLNNQRNLGSVENIKQIMNYNFSEDYVCIFHQDDLMHPKLLELSIGQLEQDPAASLTISGLKFIKAEAKGDFTNPDNLQVNVFKDEAAAVSAFLRHIKFALSSAVYRRGKLQQAVRQFNFDRFSIIWDRPFLAYLCSFGPAYVLEYPLVAYRVHPGQDSKTGPIKEENIVAFIDYYTKVIKQAGEKQVLRRLKGFSSFALIGYYLKKGEGIFSIIHKLKSPYIKLSAMSLKEWLLLIRSYIKNLFRSYVG